MYDETSLALLVCYITTKAMGQNPSLFVWRSILLKINHFIKRIYVLMVSIKNNSSKFYNPLSIN